MSKVAVVAGGTGGIGGAICLALAADGFDIAFTYRNNREGAKELSDQIARLGRKAEADSVSLEDSSAVDKFVANAAQSLGGINSAIYAAGPHPELKSIGNLTAKEWSDVIDVAVKGAFHLFPS